jgi:hypothetical protein
MVGSMGQVGSAGDNAAMESFFALLQRNVLDRRRWTARDELRIAIVTWIERHLPPTPPPSRPRATDPHRVRDDHDPTGHPGRLTHPVTRSRGSPSGAPGSLRSETFARMTICSQKSAFAWRLPS